MISDNGHSFDQVLFYGNEMNLCLFELLLFCVTDLIWENYLLNGIVVYLVICVSNRFIQRERERKEERERERGRERGENFNVLCDGPDLGKLST